MKYYRTKIGLVPGTDYKEVYHKSYAYYIQIKKRSKRRPYIRATYFNKDKIFLGLFW